CAAYGYPQDCQRYTAMAERWRPAKELALRGRSCCGDGTMSKWRVVDLHRYSGVVAAKEGRLFVGESSVALSDISVMLLGPRCQVHASVFDRAAEYSFPILACDWRHVPRSVMLPWSENSRVGARHVAQAELSAGRTKNAWMQIVKAKIAGQAHNLGNTPAGRRLKEIVRSVRSGDPANREAQA